MIVVQEIITWWTKQSRSGRVATLRNALPHELVLPWVPEIPSTPALLHHTIRFDEAREFRDPQHEMEVQDVVSCRNMYFGCVRISWDSDIVHVNYTYDMIRGGAPERYGGPRQVFSLSHGEWGRVAYNGRWSSLTGHGDWKYKQTVVNIAFVDQIKNTIFVGEPKTVFRDMADLR
jgi:hypothetical protein